MLAILAWCNSTDDVGSPFYRLFCICGRLPTRSIIWPKGLMMYTLVFLTPLLISIVIKEIRGLASKPLKDHTCMLPNFKIRNCVFIRIVTSRRSEGNVLLRD